MSLLMDYIVDMYENPNKKFLPLGKIVKFKPLFQNELYQVEVLKQKCSKNDIRKNDICSYFHRRPKKLSLRRF